MTLIFLAASLLLFRLEADGDIILPAQHGVCSLRWLSDLLFLSHWPPLCGSRRLLARPLRLAAVCWGLLSRAGVPRRVPGMLRQSRAPHTRLKLAGGSRWQRPGRQAGRTARAVEAAMACGVDLSPGLARGGTLAGRELGTAEPPRGGRQWEEWAPAAAWSWFLK